jgi:hypothetical protein
VGPQPGLSVLHTLVYCPRGTLVRDARRGGRSRDRSAGRRHP